MAREAPGQTLQATALVHEAWLRLGGDTQPEWANRAQFFSAAAEAMRRDLCLHGIDIDMLGVHAATGRVLAPGIANQYATHGLGGGAEKVTPILPGGLRIAAQLQPGFMHKRSRTAACGLVARAPSWPPPSGAVRHTPVPSAARRPAVLRFPWHAALA